MDTPVIPLGTKATLAQATFIYGPGLYGVARPVDHVKALLDALDVVGGEHLAINEVSQKVRRFSVDAHSVFPDGTTVHDAAVFSGLCALNRALSERDRTGHWGPVLPQIMSKYNFHGGYNWLRATEEIVPGVADLVQQMIAFNSKGYANLMLILRAEPGHWRAVRPFDVGINLRPTLDAWVAENNVTAAMLGITSSESFGDCHRTFGAISRPDESATEFVCAIDGNGDIVEWGVGGSAAATLRAALPENQKYAHSQGALFGADPDNLSGLDARVYFRRVWAASTPVYPSGLALRLIPDNMDAYHTHLRMTEPKYYAQLEGEKESIQAAEHMGDIAPDEDELHRLWLDPAFHAPPNETEEQRMRRETYIFRNADDFFSPRVLIGRMIQVREAIKLREDFGDEDQFNDGVQDEFDRFVTPYLNRFAAFLQHSQKTAYITRDGNLGIMIGEDVKKRFEAGGQVTIYGKSQNGTKYKRTVDAYKTWCKSAEGLRFSSITCCPKEKCPAESFNMWRGHDITPKIAADFAKLGPEFTAHKGKTMTMTLDTLLEFYYNVICGQSKEQFDYFMSYMAQRLQDPFTKLEVVLCILSHPGTGKDLMITRVMRSIIGDQHSLHCADPTQVLGRWNSPLEGKTFVVLDEVESITKALLDKFKSLITDETMLIERKFHESYISPNLTSFCILTNNLTKAVVDKIDPQDRRFAFFRCNSSINTRKDFFQDLVDFLGFERAKTDPKYLAGVKLIANYLYTRDVADFKHRDRPATQAAIEQHRMALDPVASWALDAMEAGRLSENDDRTAMIGEWDRTLKERFLRDQSSQLAAHLGLMIMNAGGHLSDAQKDLVKSAWLREHMMLTQAQLDASDEYAYVGMDKATIYNMYTDHCTSHKVKPQGTGEFWQMIKSLWGINNTDTRHAADDGRSLRTVNIPTLAVCKRRFLTVYTALESIFSDAAPKVAARVPWQMSPAGSVSPSPNLRASVDRSDMQTLDQHMDASQSGFPLDDSNPAPILNPGTHMDTNN